jgi:hypothetical protein
MLLARNQNAGQNHDKKAKSFENVAHFKYLGTAVGIQMEIYGRLNSGNACYLSVKDIMSSRLLSKNVKIRICKTHDFACGSV